MIQKVQQYNYGFRKRQKAKEYKATVDIAIDVTTSQDNDLAQSIEEQGKHLHEISSQSFSAYKNCERQASNHNNLKRYPLFTSQKNKHAWHVRRLQTQPIQKSNIYFSHKTKQRRSIFNPETPSQKTNQSFLNFKTLKNKVQQKAVAYRTGQKVSQMSEESCESAQKGQVKIGKSMRANAVNLEKTFGSYQRVKSLRDNSRKQIEDSSIEIPQQSHKKDHSSYLMMAKDRKSEQLSCKFSSTIKKENHIQMKSYNNGRLKNQSAVVHLSKKNVNPLCNYDYKDKRKYILPWVEDLSQKLYDYRFTNPKSMADKCRFSQQGKRQQFEKMVHESSLASKILTNEEISALFEEVKASEPRQNWWRRIVDYGCDKRKRIYQYEHLSSSLQR